MFSVDIRFFRRKYISIIFMLCLTYVVFVFALEHSHVTVFGANMQDVCRGNDCMANEYYAGSNSVDSSVPSADMRIHVIIAFTNADHKYDLQAKFTVTVISLFQHCTRPVTLYIIGDSASHVLAKNILTEHVQELDKYKVRIIIFHHIVNVTVSITA